MKTITHSFKRLLSADGFKNPNLIAAKWMTVCVLMAGWLATSPVATARPTFSGSAVYPAGGIHNYGIAVGDFNGDGRPDLATVSVISHEVFVFINRGGGNFDAAVSFPSDNPARQLQAVAVGDMNGDGKLDLVAVDGTLEAVVVFLGRGDGTFSEGRGFPCGSANNRYLALADFDEDGHLDVISVSGGTSVIPAAASLLRGNGDGTLRPASTFLWPTSDPDAVGSGVAVADLNRDGHADVVIADAFNPTIVFLGHGDGTFGPGLTIPADPGAWRALTIADLNRDGIPDIIGVAPVRGSGSGYLPKVVAALGHGDGTFAAAVQFSLQYNLLAGIAVADFDGGGPDIAVTGYDGQVEILLGRGDGTFGDGSFREPNETYFLGGPRADNLLAADLNGDGLPDLAVATQEASTLSSGLITFKNTTIPRIGHLRMLTPPTAQVGGRTSATVMAYDQFDRLFEDYRGTVEFLTSDSSPCTRLPHNYNFDASDAGIHTFDQEVTLMSIGAQTLTVKDSASPLVQDTETILLSGGLTVTTLADVVAEEGQVSLREAIQRANALARLADNPAIITFNICAAGPGPLVIKPLSELPALHSRTVIDGFSQPGANPNTLEVGEDAVWRIVLDGEFAGAAAVGLTLETPVEVRGLEIRQFSGGGITAHKGGGAIIQGNYIHDNLVHGILLQQGNSLVGGPSPEDRNIISGNQTTGIWAGNDISGNVGHRIQGNYIGTDTQGLETVAGHALGGIVIAGCSNTVIGGASERERNVISGNTGPGIVITGNAQDAVIRANYIGLNANGDASLGNPIGMVVSNALRTVIGGSKFADGNVISGNLLHGLILARDARETLVRANRLGTKASGGGPLPNGGDGIVVLANASDTQIGGGTAAAANIISANQANGIRLSGGNHTQILGNLIGTAIGGLGPLGNFGAGIAIGPDSEVPGAPDNNFIGTIAPGTGNVIAYNSQAGVLAKTGFKNSIRGNSIYSNVGLGIDLGGDGFSPNDPGDGDSGPNEMQNSPVVTSAVSDGATLRLAGTFNGAPGVSLNIDIYWSLQCHATGFGEGRIYLGSDTITTDPTGYAGFSNSFAVTVPVGAVVTATATTTLGNSSEFSPCLPVGSGGFFPRFDGLDYRELGSAIATPASDTIEVSNIGSSGDDGVEVKLGGAGGWRTEFLWPPLTDSFHLSVDMTGQSGGNSDQPFGSAFYDVKAGLGSLVVDFAALHSLKSKIELRDMDGVTIAIGNMDNAAPLHFSTTTTSFAGDGLGIVPVKLSTFGGSRGVSICLEFSEDVFIDNLPATVKQSPDSAHLRTIWLTAMAGQPVQNLSGVTIRAGLPPPPKGGQGNSFQMVHWDLLAFGYFHHPGGANILAKTGTLPEDFSLRLQNPVVGGLVTSVIEVKPASGGRFNWLEFSPSDLPTDSTLGISFQGFTGGSNGGHNKPVSGLTLRSTNPGIALTGTMGAWNGALVRVQILRQGRLVFDELRPLNQPLGALSGWPTGVEAGNSDDSSIYGILIGLLFPAEHPAVFTTGKASYEGDTIRVSAGQPTEPMRYLESFTLGFNLNQITILGEGAAPATLPPLGVRSNKGDTCFVFSSEAGRRYRLLSSGVPNPAVWNPASTFVGEGTSQVIPIPPSPKGDGAQFFRLWAE
ncbi:MAG: hypothetical protein JWM16_5244 [Verrucomicrobiales bacterium]|nr:hypothetical protein [Verrucomicrobiales bacterium]